MWKLILNFSFIILLYSCRNYYTSEALENNVEIISEDTTTIVVCSMPAPLQFAQMIKSVNFEYNNNIVEKSLINNYSLLSQSELATKLGIISVDLGYSIIFDKKQNALKFFSISKSISEQLGIEGIINKDIVNRFENNLNNTDSLTNLTLKTFNNINIYLESNERNTLIYCILCGSLIESIYISSYYCVNNPNLNSKNILLQNYFYLENAIKLLSDEKNINTSYNQIYIDLKELKLLFDKFKIDYKVINNQSYIENYYFSKSNAEEINDLIKIIRNKYF